MSERQENERTWTDEEIDAPDPVPSEEKAWASFLRGQDIFENNVISFMPHFQKRAAELEARGESVQLTVDLDRLSEDNVTDLFIYFTTLEIEGERFRALSHKLWRLEKDPTYDPLADDGDDAGDLDPGLGATAEIYTGEVPGELHKHSTEAGETILNSGEIACDGDESEWASRFADRLQAQSQSIPSPMDEQPQSNAALDALALMRDETGPVTSVLAPSRRFRRFTNTNHSLQLNGAWLVKGLLPAHGINTIIGASGAGKTFLFLDLLLHIAMGWPWRGRRTKKCPVTYVAAEAGVLAQNRIIGWCIHHGVPWPDNFHLIADNVNLFVSNADAVAIIDDIKINQPGCGVVGIDTLARAITGGNEREGKDMGVLIGHAEHIASELEAALYLIHHTGKAAEKGSRGASELPGAVNFEGTVTREKEPGAIGTLKVTKQRDGLTGTELHYALKDIELGSDEDGDLVTTAVAVEPEPVADSYGTVERDLFRTKGRKLSDYQMIVLGALTQLINERGQPNPGGDGFPDAGRVRTVSAAQLVSFAAEKLVSADKKERPRIVARAITALQGRGLVKVQGGLIWNPEHMGG